MKRTTPYAHETQGFAARRIVMLLAGLITVVALGTFGAGAALASGGDDSNPGSNPAVDREYVLEAFYRGYVGLEGEIEGVTNPVLTAAAGETVRITIVNGESFPHDIALERHGVSSSRVNRPGRETSVTFTAESDDVYFCSVSGHRQAGMEGRFRLE